MLSQVTLMGRLGADSELRYTPSGQAVCEFSLAVQPYGQEEPDWWRVTCWEKQAEFAANHLAKGCRCLVIGTPRLEEWTDKEGGHHAKLAATARTIQAIDWAADAAADEEAASPEPPPAPRPAPASRPAPRPAKPPRYPNRG